MLRVTAGSSLNLFSSVPATILAIFTIIVIVTGALAVARSTYYQRRAEALAAWNQDQANRINELTNELKAVDTKYEAERARREALEQVVTAREELIRMNGLLQQVIDRLSPRRTEGQ